MFWIMFAFWISRFYHKCHPHPLHRHPHRFHHHHRHPLLPHCFHLNIFLIFIICYANVFVPSIIFNFLPFVNWFCSSSGGQWPPFNQPTACSFYQMLSSLSIPTFVCITCLQINRRFVFCSTNRLRFDSNISLKSQLYLIIANWNFASWLSSQKLTSLFV